jgi:hypothetical protein
MNQNFEISTSWNSTLAKGAAMTALFAFSIFPNPRVSNENLVPHRLMENISSSRSGTMQIWEASRANRIRSTKGKYAHVRTSSEEFALRKQREIEQEG